jgi:hypothetical protein
MYHILSHSTLWMVCLKLSRPKQGECNIIRAFFAGFAWHLCDLLCKCGDWHPKRAPYPNCRPTTYTTTLKPFLRAAHPFPRSTTICPHRASPWALRHCLPWTRRFHTGMDVLVLSNGCGYFKIRVFLFCVYHPALCTSSSPIEPKVYLYTLIMPIRVSLFSPYWFLYLPMMDLGRRSSWPRSWSWHIGLTFTWSRTQPACWPAVSWSAGGLRWSGMLMHLALPFPINIDLTLYSFVSPKPLDLILVSILFLQDLDVFMKSLDFFQEFRWKDQQKSGVFATSVAKMLQM